MMTNNQSTPPNMHSRGGIDQQIQDGMNRSGNDPAKAKEVYGKSGDVKDLLVWQKLANTFKEIDKATALAKNGSPPTLMDSLPQEVMGRMTGKQNLQEKASGVAGVLQTQQQQQQRQGQGQPQGQPRGQPQGQPMRAASGGIINAPAPNLNRMYNGGIVGYKDGGEISREEYIAKVKALIASGVAQEDAMAQMDAEFDISSGTREERRDVSLEDNRLLPKGNRRFIRADEVYKTQAPGTVPRNTRNTFMGKSPQGNQPYSVSDPEGDLLAAIAGEKQPEVEPDSTQRQLGTTQMGMGRQPIAGDMNQDLGAMIEVNKGKIEPIRALTGPEVEPEVEPRVLPEGNGMSPVMTRKERGEKALRDLGLDKKQGISALEPFMRKSEVNPNQSPIMTLKQQAEANKPLSGSAAIQAKLDAMRGKKGLAGLVERFANTSFTPTYGGTGEALAQAGRDIAKTGKDEKAAERKFLEEQLGVQQGIEAKAVEAKAKESEYARTLGQQIDEFTKTMEASSKQFKAELEQNRAYQDAMIAVREQANEISKITGGNQNALLSAKNKQQVFAILTTMRTNHREMTRLEVESITNRLGNVATNIADAEAHQKTRNAEFEALQKSLVGTLNSDEGAGELTITARK